MMMLYPLFSRSRAVGQKTAQHKRRICSRQLGLESLEDRTLLAAVVWNTADAGQGTLRNAVGWANANPGADTIEFDASLAGMTITLTSGELRITDSLTIRGPGADRLRISGNNASRIFDVGGTAVEPITVRISGLALINGRVSYETLAPMGGAVSNSANLTITACTIADSRALYAGGVFNSGTLVVSGSTIANNFAGDGGGGIASIGTLTVINSTIAGNSATHGGGIMSMGTLTMTNSTVANNLGGVSGGGILNIGTLTAANSIVAGNTAAVGPDVADTGTIASAKHNVIQNGSNGESGSSITDGVDGNQVGVDVLLDPAGLQDHGGPTPTIALLSGSPALDAGSSVLALAADGSPLTFDQRGFGFFRLAGAEVDVGAWEAQHRPPMFDVKPGNGDEIDPISLRANGTLSMVIYSDGIDNFDASTVDLTSIRLNGKLIDPRHYAFEDINGDGELDLVLHFAMSEIRDHGVFDPEIVDSQILTLTADIEGGEQLIEDDWIRLVPVPNHKGRR